MARWVESRAVRRFLFSVNLLIFAATLAAWPASHCVGVKAGWYRGGEAQTVLALSSGELLRWQTSRGTQILVPPYRRQPFWYVDTFDSRTEGLDSDFIDLEDTPLARFAGFAWGDGVTVIPLWAPALVLAVPAVLMWRQRRRDTGPGFEVAAVPNGMNS